MKDKTITKIHYDYVNDIVIILGFKNLADFCTNISYTILKLNQEYICLKINETLDIFKKLFPQEKFDLRKINYTFKNINQVIGFIKKLFNHLCIPWDYYRVKEIPTMRLIQPNNLYYNYILNMSEIPPNSFTLTEIKKIPFINISEIIEKFEKKDIIKKIIVQNIFEINDIDWIKSVKITLSNGEELPNNTQISLIINHEELVIKQDICSNYCIGIELPNKFLYSNSIFFKISDKYTNLENNEKYLIEVDGYNILNKCLLSNEKIIKFNHKSFYSSLDLGIYDNMISIGINDFYKARMNDKDDNEDDIKNPVFICTMKYVLSYLKKCFEKEYNILNEIDFGLVLFDYFNYVKIRNEDGNKLLIGTVIEFAVGSVILDYVINEDTKFDKDNYYKFDIDFPNKILYKYHFSKLLIKNPNQKFYNIIVNGSQFKSSIPKKILNSDILFNHDSKWFVENEKKFVSISGMVGNTLKVNISNNTNLSKNPNVSYWSSSSIRTEDKIENAHIYFFKKYEKDNKIINKLIELKTNIYQNIVFINNELNIDIIETDLMIYLVIYLVDPVFLEYLKLNKYLEKDSQNFSIGLNSYLFKNKFPDICENVLNKKYRLFYSLDNTSSYMVSNIEIYLNDEIKTIYDINAWIEFDDKIIFDFGSNQMNKKTMLNFYNQVINLINVNNKKKFLVIEIPLTEISNWKNINIMGCLIYTSCSKFKKQLLSENNNIFKYK